MRKISGIFLAGMLLAAWICPKPAEALTRDVCKSGCAYSSIQAAIGDSLTGDTVLVHDGTYGENITFSGKAITVRSVNGAATTIIDGKGAGAVATFNNNEGAGSVLEGLTLTNGYRTYGGGIDCEYASPTITGCIVRDNAATYGGGIWLSNSSPRITDTTIRGNTADYGGGMYPSDSSPVIERSVISGNEAAISGGGIYCSQSDYSTEIYNTTISGNTASDGGGIYVRSAYPVITYSTISGNTADSEGGGIYYTGSDAEDAYIRNTLITGNTAAYGGGVYCVNSSVWIERSVISRNHASMGGGGINYYSTPLCRITNSTVSGNSADGVGGGIACSGSSPSISNTTLSGNRSESGGAALYALFNSFPILVNCTLSGNATPMDGGGIYIASSSSATVMNSILWGDGPQEVFVSAGTPPAITYSNVEGGDPGNPGSPWPGEGNIDDDPLFADPRPYSEAPTAGGDYRLGSGSPSVDTASEDDMPARFDQSGDWRPQGSGCDMGADEFALLFNGSFEEVNERVPVPWSGKKLGRNDGRVTQTASTGDSSFMMNGTVANKRLRQVLRISGSGGDSFILGGLSKADGAASSGGFYGLEAKFFYNDGTRKTYRVAFTKGSHDWEYKEKVFTAGKKYKKVVVTLRYARQSGKAWFDDIRLDR